MPVIRVPFGEWKPDLGEWEHDGLYRVKGAVYSNGQWLPAPAFDAPAGGNDISDLVNTASALGQKTFSQVMGFHIHRVAQDGSAGDIRFAWGTDTYLAMSDENDITIDFTLAPGGSAVTPYSGWQFTSFGDNVYATSREAGIYIGGETSGNWASAITATSSSGATIYSPAPRYVTTIKNHLLLGGLKYNAVPTGSIFSVGPYYPHLVHWSVTDAPGKYGDPSNTQDVDMDGSDFQQLFDDYGPITGMIGGDYALIFKESAIYRMDGPPFTFHPVVLGAGTRFPNSIVKYYDDTYFWGPAGPMRYVSGSSEPEILGRDKVSRTVIDSVNSRLRDYAFQHTPDYTATTALGGSNDETAISAAADYRSGLVVFCVGDTLTSTGPVFTRPGIMLCYDVHSGRFSSFDVPNKMGFIRGITMNGVLPIYKTSSGDDARPSRVLDGIYGVGVSDGAATTAHFKHFAAFADSSDTQATAPADEWSPQFIWPYNSLVNEKGQPVATKIRRIRIPWSLNREGVLPGDGTSVYKLVITVKIRSKNRPSDNYEEVTGTLDTSLTTFQDSAGWIDFPEACFSTYHQLEVKFTASIAGTASQRWISYLDGLRYVEIEYESGATTGGAYLTS